MKIELEGLPTERTRNYGPKNYHDWYEALIDMKISQPAMSMGDLAKHFDVSANWLSSVVHSDMFKARFLQRRLQLSEEIDASLKIKLGRVADRGLEMMTEALSEDGQAVKKTPLMDVAEITNKSLERLGYGVKQGPSVVVNNQQVIETGASRDVLEDVRRSIKQTQIEGVANQPPEGHGRSFCASEVRIRSEEPLPLFEEGGHRSAAQELAPQLSPEVASLAEDFDFDSHLWDGAGDGE